jgi:hypothetical protein
MGDVLSCTGQCFGICAERHRGHNMYEGSTISCQLMWMWCMSEGVADVAHMGEISSCAGQCPKA